MVEIKPIVLGYYFCKEQKEWYWIGNVAFLNCQQDSENSKQTSLKFVEDFYTSKELALEFLKEEIGAMLSRNVYLVVEEDVFKLALLIFL